MTLNWHFTQTWIRWHAALPWIDDNWVTTHGLIILTYLIPTGNLLEPFCPLPRCDHPHDCHFRSHSLQQPKLTSTLQLALQSTLNIKPETWSCNPPKHESSHTKTQSISDPGCRVHLHSSGTWASKNKVSRLRGASPGKSWGLQVLPKFLPSDSNNGVPEGVQGRLVKYSGYGWACPTIVGVNIERRHALHDAQQGDPS